MRPRTLAEFIGQDAILGQGRLLRRAIQADQLSSLIFYGPPGTGKTTLARVIANTTRAHFIALNAVLAGVKEIREAIATAQERQQHQQQRTLLFVDEVHRFNKSQQDALLPWVENGTVILIGATTENPYFEVNKALISRSRLFQLQPLTSENVRHILQQALADPERGYGDRAVQVTDEALQHWITVANGDARTALNALELAVETTPANPDGILRVTLAIAEDSIQRRAVLYDKEGDAHFDTISAFIKSLRGSDPDAALYWLAKMVYAGEDPRFIFRRMLILAGEDVGMADSQAVVVVAACAAAFDRIGMPEGRYPLAHAALYLATAAKSNSVMGFFDALATVETERESEIPAPLKDANRDKQGFGHGAGYLYPHAYRDHWVAQQYLPRGLQGQVFYQPSDQGDELSIQMRVAQRREAQLAAVVDGSLVTPLEVLTTGGLDRASDRWLQRTLSQTGETLGRVRDRLFTLAPPQSHHIILDMNAGSGLLTWEAVRRVPEGGVYACAWTQTQAVALEEQAAQLSPLARPIVLACPFPQLPDLLAQQSTGDHSHALRCDRLIGRNLLSQALHHVEVLQQLQPFLHAEGSILLAETVPHRAQRLYSLLDPDWIPKQLYAELAQAEEAVYTNDPHLSWTPDTLVQRFSDCIVTIEQEQTVSELVVTPALIDRWFRRSSATSPLTYADRLAQFLPDAAIALVRQAFTRLIHQTLPWTSTIAFIHIHTIHNRNDCVNGAL